MTNHIVDANKMVPPPHLLKKFSEQARVDSKKRGHSGYCKTFARLCIDWALNSRAAQTEPPTLKEQALDELTSAERLYPADWSTIRFALEALPND